MAQSDYNIGANLSGLVMRTEINTVFSSILTNNSGTVAPTVTSAFMTWVDTSNSTYYYLKMRNHDNTAWVTLFIYTVSTKIITPFIISSPTTNALPRINADGTLANSSITTDANGNLGVNTTIAAFGATTRVIQIRNASLGGAANSQAAIRANIYFDGTNNRYISNDYASTYEMLAGAHKWYSASSGAAGSITTLNTLMTLDLNGNLTLNSPTGLLGYGIGGTVTQLINKATTVTLNKPTGQIITSNAALAGNSGIAFSFNNSLLGVGDDILITVNSLNYRVFANTINTGGCTILIENRTAGLLSEVLTLNYKVFKGATA